MKWNVEEENVRPFVKFFVRVFQFDHFGMRNKSCSIVVLVVTVSFSLSMYTSSIFYGVRVFTRLFDSPIWNQCWNTQPRLTVCFRHWKHNNKYLPSQVQFRKCAIDEQEYDNEWHKHIMTMFYEIWPVVCYKNCWYNTMLENCGALLSSLYYIKAVVWLDSRRV